MSLRIIGETGPRGVVSVSRIHPTNDKRLVNLCCDFEFVAVFLPQTKWHLFFFQMEI